MKNHPFDDLLLEYVCGALSPAAELVVATHLTMCTRCREHVADLEAIGGSMLDRITPAEVDDAVHDRVMAALDDEGDDLYVAGGAVAPIDGFDLPLPLRAVLGPDIGALAWQPNGPGVDSVSLDIDAAGGIAVVTRIQPNAGTPTHNHVGEQLGLVIDGCYTDEFGEFARGDFLVFAREAIHTPRSGPDRVCLCLTVTIPRTGDGSDDEPA
ncbi:MAG: ChrR family anti-sigma-E factor [Alphaproteobacteria bacterium]